MIQEDEIKNIIQGILLYIKKNIKEEDRKEFILEFKKALSRQEKTVKVTSSVSLDQIQKNNLISILKKEFIDEISVEFIIDKSIIGGIKIEYGDILIDKTFTGSLNDISISMSG